MSQFSWDSVPQRTQAQVHRVTRQISRLLASNLVGVYLHGSLAMSCFNPRRSDLDLLVVTRQPMGMETKRGLAAHLLDASCTPHPIEISFLVLETLQAWKHPAPYDFHYSESWRQRIRQELASGHWQMWNSQACRDPDLAAHITITKRRGICLAGGPIADVFPEIPREDYLDSIQTDVKEALAQIAKDPAYAILNACRTLAFIRDGLICSKREGGLWALDIAPEYLRSTIEQALETYAAGNKKVSFDPTATARFAEYMSRHLLD